MSRSTEVTIEIECELDDEYFEEWETLSPEIQAYWKSVKGGTHCDGSGVISSSCYGCQFCKSFYEDNPQP